MLTSCSPPAPVEETPSEPLPEPPAAISPAAPALPEASPSQLVTAKTALPNQPTPVEPTTMDPALVTAAATPIPTPHPAAGATQAALKLYPELSKKDSMFNRAFLDLFEDRRKTDPVALSKPDWPLVLAKETANMLGDVLNQSKTIASNATPPPAEAPATASAKSNWLQERIKQPGALERGAYNQRQAIYPRRYYYYYDSNGRYWIDIYGQRHYY